MRTLVAAILLSSVLLHAQNDGIWQGYDPEWSHVSRELIALATSKD
jgi:hypothetical protein